MHWRKKWQPTPVFLPGEPQGRRAWWAAVYGSHRVRYDWSDLAAAAAAVICITSMQNTLFSEKCHFCILKFQNRRAAGSLRERKLPGTSGHLEKCWRVLGEIVDLRDLLSGGQSVGNEGSSWNPHQANQSRRGRRGPSFSLLDEVLGTPWNN